MSDPELLRRRIIESIVSNICINGGFAKTEAFALETLCEMFVNCKFKTKIALKRDITI